MEQAERACSGAHLSAMSVGTATSGQPAHPVTIAGAATVAIAVTEADHV